MKDLDNDDKQTQIRHDLEIILQKKSAALKNSPSRKVHAAIETEIRIIQRYIEACTESRKKLLNQIITLQISEQALLDICIIHGISTQFWAGFSPTFIHNTAKSAQKEGWATIPDAIIKKYPNIINIPPSPKQ